MLKKLLIAAATVATLATASIGTSATAEARPMRHPHGHAWGWHHGWNRHCHVRSFWRHHHLVVRKVCVRGW